MGMGADIIAVYRRAAAFACAMPLVVAIPVMVEMLRHGVMTPGWTPRAIVLGFTLLSTLAMLVVITVSVRWWRFEGDRDQLWRWRSRVLWGAMAMMAIQLIDEIIFTTAGHMAADIAGQGRAFFVAGAQLLWLFVSVPLFPWYVALLSDDPLTLPQSLKAIRPRWVYGFGVIFGALLPVLVLGPLVRLLSPASGIEQAVAALVSGIMVAATMLVTDSAYFAAYRIVREGD